MRFPTRPLSVLALALGLAAAGIGVPQAAAPLAASAGATVSPRIAPLAGAAQGGGVAGASVRTGPATTAAEIGPRSTPRITAELVSASAWAAPGSTAVLAVRQDIRPDWHTYWRNPGDSGGATTLDWTLPPRAVAGDIVWPLPERQPLSGLMNYGYSGQVYLPVPVQIPADAPVGRRLPIRVEALFLVCSAEMCVPDELSLGLDLLVAEGAPPPDPRHGTAIQRTLQAAPRPAPVQAGVTLTDGMVRLTAVGGPLAGGDPGPTYFFPFQGGVIDHAAVQTGQWGPQGLTLDLRPGGATAGGITGPIAGVLSTADGAYEIEAAPGPAPPGATGRTLTPVSSAGETVGAASPGAASTTGPLAVIQVMAFALLGGLILNLMPCVFPILAMKAASLTASAHDPTHARRDGFAFLAGVLATFVTLSAALIALRAAGQAAGWGFQLQSPPVTGGLALLMLAVGLNLSGVFEVGGRLQAVGGAGGRRSGPAGAFLTGVLAVVVAAPCTAPFMAFALGAALVMPWPLALGVFACLGLGLALPYLLVSVSPGLLRRLPPPGPWMERLKGFLAFPMYGAALWLAWVFSRQVGSDFLALLFTTALLLALGLWLVGVRQAARALGRGGLAGGIAAAVTLGAAAVLFGVTAVTGQGASFDRTGAQDGRSEPLAAAGAWSPQAVSEAVADGRPVLVNFTADWCVTCKINERTSLGSAAVARVMRETGAVYLVGDWTRRDDAITAELARRGRSGVPLYVVHPADGGAPRVLPQLLTPGLVVQALTAAAPSSDRASAPITPAVRS